MYLYLGGKYAINSKKIVGIFDMDNTTVSKKTRDFLNNAEKSGNVIYTSYDLPKAFLICDEGKNQKIYVTALSTQTLKKRMSF